MKMLSLTSLTVLIGITGCAGNFNRIPQPEFDRSGYQDLGPASETATGAILFGYIPIMQNSKLARATESAIAQKGGDTIVDVTIRERWYWIFVGNLHKVDIEGTILKKID